MLFFGSLIDGSTARPAKGGGLGLLVLLAAALLAAPAAAAPETAPAPAAAILPGEPAETLRAGLEALRREQAGLALSLRDRLAEGSLERKALTWAIATDGRNVPSTEIAAAAAALPGWPGAMSLRENSEKALLRENHPPDVVVAAFGATRPQTFEGTVVLGRAFLAQGRRAEALALLSPFWRRTELEAGAETRFLEEFGAVLPQVDHRVRMERMLYAERLDAAARVAGAAGAKELCGAWSAAVRGRREAGALLDAVPQAQRSAGWQFAKARALRRAERLDEAARLMLAAPGTADALIDPDAWWIERRSLSRTLFDRGEARLAYRVAAGHAAESPTETADAEFHAGWFALRGLRDAPLASGHFKRITEVATAPISRSRGFYWLGRAAEAGGGASAEGYYAQAARFGTTFYGQLAAVKLKQQPVAPASPSPTADDRAAFAKREAAGAIALLEAAGAERLAGRLTRALADELDSPGEMALLIGMAERRGDHYLALRLAKTAAARGVAVGGLTHPLGAIPASADLSSAGRALAYAVARQESEFNLGAVSGAGARGLLQLLPGTARETARKAGLPYSLSRLTGDPGYNASLGAAFLSEQLGRFRGSYVLTFAGYNAGPGRAREWVAKYGDPRGRDLDGVVDWIERIPFTETRSYVQRVMENYQVYKLRIAGACDIADDLVRGR